MLKDCLEVFNKDFKKYGDKIILDSYFPDDGTYLIVEPKDGSYRAIEIKKDRKNKTVDRSVEYFNEICAYDYNSKLIEMNKPIKNKIIHSNNYLSFSIKKDNLINEKLTFEIIDEYYDILSDPLTKKYKNSKAKEVYKKVESEIGPINLDILEKNRYWIKENILKLKDKINLTEKNHIKIFFKYPIEDYQKEGKRYLVPNIYNTIDFNQSYNNHIYGLSNNNMALNKNKKPYLENKSRKVGAPYLITIDEAILQQKFFDYLLNFAQVGKNTIYIDDKIIALSKDELMDKKFTGYYLRIYRDMNTVIIEDYDTINNFNPRLKKNFIFSNIFSNNTKLNGNYGTFENLSSVKDLINEIFFSNYLSNNYFTDPKDFPKEVKGNFALKNCILESRDGLFNWFYKGDSSAAYSIINKISMILIKDSIKNDYFFKTLQQINLRCSLIEYFQEGERMSDKVDAIENNIRRKINSTDRLSFESDEEYHFAIGQIAYYLLSKNQSNNKSISLINPVIQSANDEIIKSKITSLFQKYNYAIGNNIRFNELYRMVLSYESKSNVNKQMIIIGYLSNNLIYEKKEGKN